MSIVRVGLVFLLSACSVVSVKPEGHYSRLLMLPLYELECWSFEGRLALTGEREALSANINWEHSPGADKIKLSGPLGQGSIVITLAGNVVTIDRGGGDVRSSKEPESFINQELGMFVPVRSLRYWVVGLPEPSLSFKDAGAGFNQEGWLTEYMQMQSITEDRNMPRKMTVINGQVKLKLIIDRWDINDSKTN